MDDDNPNQSLADDPNFLASLEDLDRGLTGGQAGPSAPGRASVRPMTPRPDEGRSQPAAPATADPPRIRPVPPPVEDDTLVVDDDMLRVDEVEPAPAPPEAEPPPGRRSLLELFPPAPRTTTLAPVPPPKPPQVARGGTREGTSADAAGSCEAFYGLNETPFSLSTDPKFFYHSTSHDRVVQELLSAIRHREGVVLVTGEAGTGKTTLCRVVIDQLDRRTLTSLVAERFETVEELIKRVLVDFGVISHEDLTTGRLGDAPREHMRMVLREFLASLGALQAFAVVLIDEAHQLPATVLEEILALGGGVSPAAHAGAPTIMSPPSDALDTHLLQVVLVGEPALLRELGRPELRELIPRARVRCTLEPLTADEIPDYVQHRLAGAGASPRVEFSGRALARLHQWSDGVPRVVNLVCDRALQFGFEAAADVIDERIIDRAAEDLEIARPDSRTAAVVRFLVAGLLFLGLVVVGAAAGAFVFSDRVAHFISQWEAIPTPPRSPELPQPQPYVALPTPHP